MVLSPGTPVLLPHKIQTPNVTLARKFVTGVRSETNIKPHKVFGSFLTVFRSRGVSCSLLLLPSGMWEVTLYRVDFLYKIQDKNRSETHFDAPSVASYARHGDITLEK